MSSRVTIGFSDADAATLATAVATISHTQAVIAAAQAAQTRALAAAGAVAIAAGRASRSSRNVDMAMRSVAAEIAGVLRSTDRSVQRQIGDALTLVDDYPNTLTAWETGAITRGHVYAVTDAGSALPLQARAAFDEQAARRCTEETPNRVKGELALLAERLHPRTLTERHVQARETRTVKVIPLTDGMSELCTVVPTLLAHAMYDRLTQQAQVIKDARKNPPAGSSEADAVIITSDTRKIDQIRADLVTDMLLTSAPGADPTRTDDGPGVLGAIRAKVQVLVPALTLLGSDRDAADLVGHAPIDPDTARQLLGSLTSPLERILTHPVTGAVLHVDTYQRTAAIDRFIRGRDQHCRFPGCRLAAIRCESDHTIDYALGGPTDTRNLAQLCQRHHSMKQFTPWKVMQTEGGVLHWTSPLGTTYTDKPPNLGVHFGEPPRPETEPEIDPEPEPEPDPDPDPDPEHSGGTAAEREAEPACDEPPWAKPPRT